MLVSFYVDRLREEGLLVKANLADDCEVSGVSYNSLKVEPGDIFVCKGVTFKPAYLEMAIDKGAVAYVAEQEYEIKDSSHRISAIIVEDVRKAMAALAIAHYGKPSDKMKVIGVTGTKGKTSTIYYIKAIIDDYEAAMGRKPAGLTSGIHNYDGVHTDVAELTTPEILDMYKYLDTAVNSGLDFFTLEASSQALKYDRINGVDFEVGVFINIGIDHISPKEHPTYEDYLESKLRIFDHSRTAVYNMDCDNQDELRAAVSKVEKRLGYSQKDTSANVYAYNQKSVLGKVSFDVAIRNAYDYPDCDFHVDLGPFGLINISNALAAIATCALLGIPVEYMQSGLNRVVVAGRMQIVTSSDGKRMGLVDYAHNELSFRVLFETIRQEFPGWKTIAVFGSSGAKALVRRKGLGEVAGQYADYSIVTEEDHATEPVMQVCEEIASHIEAVGGKYEIIPDRFEAVKRACEIMDEKTLVLVLGKGDETFLRRGNVTLQLPSDVDKLRVYLDHKEFECLEV